MSRCHSSYARDDANITIRGATLSDNVVARGSVAFILSSYLYTDQVIFSDIRESPDLLAVQVGDDSTYIAVETTFAGFEGEVGGR